MNFNDISNPNTTYTNPNTTYTNPNTTYITINSDDEEGYYEVCEDPTEMEYFDDHSQDQNKNPDEEDIKQDKILKEEHAKNINVSDEEMKKYLEDMEQAKLTNNLDKYGLDEEELLRVYDFITEHLPNGMNRYQYEYDTFMKIWIDNKILGDGDEQSKRKRYDEFLNLDENDRLQIQHFWETQYRSSPEGINFGIDKLKIFENNPVSLKRKINCRRNINKNSRFFILNTDLEKPSSIEFSPNFQVRQFIIPTNYNNMTHFTRNQGSSTPREPVIVRNDDPHQKKRIANFLDNTHQDALTFYNFYNTVYEREDGPPNKKPRNDSKGGKIQKRKTKKINIQKRKTKRNKYEKTRINRKPRVNITRRHSFS